MSKPIVVIGGGPAGLEAARAIGDLGVPCVLVEKRDRLGGNPDSASYSTITLDTRSAREALDAMIGAVTGHPLVDVRLETEVVGRAGEAGAFQVQLQKAGNRNGSAGSAVDASAIVVATGFDHFDPGRETQMYGYYEFDDVITLVDAERMFSEHRFVKPSTGEPPKRVCFIQCVGSRDRRIGNEYCSKVCCGVASKQAIEIKQLLPDAKVWIFYIDMRMYGHWEEKIYWPAQEQYKVQYVRGIVTEILRKGDGLLIRGEDTTLGRPMEIPMDVVVLSVGMEPSVGTRRIAQSLEIPQDKYGFIHAPHEPLDPVSTGVAGIYVAGAAAGPKDLEDSVGMANMAAMKAVALARRGALVAPAG